MNEKNSLILKSFLISIAAVIAIVFVLNFLGNVFPEAFDKLKVLADQYGLLGIFLVMFVGGTLFPLPVDAFYIFLIQISSFPFLILLVSIIASFFSGIVNYYIGYFLQDKIFGRLIKKESLDKTKKLFDKYGPIAIIIFGAIPLSPVEDPISLLSGLVKMDKKKFALYWLISRILSFALLTTAALLIVH